MKNVNPVNWFDINVSNLNNAKEFYETVFNIKLIDFPKEFGKQSGFPFDPKGINITGALVEKEDFMPSSSNTVIYFESEDCVTEEKLVVEAGGKIIRPKMSIGEFGFVSIFMDKDGNTIGLHSKK
ncbi:VOC family protein [Cellulophaga lytica]|nr:VOC family protein [Cellulophaga lytica]